MVINFPKLSPSMTKGRVTKWYVRPGMEVRMTELLFEVETDELTEEKKTFLVDVEAHDEGVLSKVFHSSDEILSVGSPIGILCEDLRDVDAFKELNPADVSSYSGRGFLWQAYVRGGEGGCKC